MPNNNTYSDECQNENVYAKDVFDNMLQDSKKIIDRSISTTKDAVIHQYANNKGKNKVNSSVSYLKEYASLNAPKQFGSYTSKKATKESTKKVSKEVSKEIAKESSKQFVKEGTKVSAKALTTVAGTTVGTVVPGVGNIIGFAVGEIVGDGIDNISETKGTIKGILRESQNAAKNEYIKGHQSSILDEDSSRVVKLAKGITKFINRVTKPLIVIAGPMFASVGIFTSLIFAIIIGFVMMISSVLMGGGSSRQPTAGSYLDDMIYYCQWDSQWGSKPYGKSGTIANAGCGITCMAMCVATFADTTITPAEMADYSVNCGARIEGSGTAMGTLVPRACSNWNLHYESISGEMAVRQAVQDGKLVIWGSKGNSLFSNSSAGHVMIIRAYDGNGYLLADPNKAEKNYISYSWSQISSNAKGYYYSVWGDNGRLVFPEENVDDLDLGSGDTRTNGGALGPRIIATPEHIGDSLGTYTVTAYCTCRVCCGVNSGNNRTASGTIPTSNRTLAVDTSIIPFGTKLVINGQVYVAEDRGGAIRGNHIDMFFYTHKQALEWGNRKVEVYLYKE